MAKKHADRLVAQALLRVWCPQRALQHGRRPILSLWRGVLARGPESPQCHAHIARLVPLGSLLGRTLGRYPLHHKGRTRSPGAFARQKGGDPQKQAAPDL